MFKRLLDPTAQSSMSKIFRFLESLWKTNGKKGLRFEYFFLIKGVKLPRKKVGF